MPITPLMPPSAHAGGTARNFSMTITDDTDVRTTTAATTVETRPQPAESVEPVEPVEPETNPVAVSGLVVARTTGMAISIVGLTSWAGWLAWRIGDLGINFLGALVLVVELVAFAAALVVTGGLWVASPRWRRDRRAGDERRPLPVLLAEALDLGNVLTEAAGQRSIGGDDTGEIAWARRGIRMLGDEPTRRNHTTVSQRIRDAAWAVVAIDGLRRLLAIGLIIVVLFTGVAPFSVPPTTQALLLICGISALGVGHWLLSAGHIRPGSRLRWSMASVGAGLGDGVSRSGFPLRWIATISTVVALNIAVALRGISDRWTHGLGPMERDERIVAMSLAVATVVAGGAALRRMPRPDLGHYGATRRLEERSVRLLAVGLTLLIASIGFVAGVLPA